MCSRQALGWVLSCFISSLGFADPAIHVQVSVYWEGRELKDPNIEALTRFRTAYPDIPLTHFFNPTYVLDDSTSGDNLRLLQNVVRNDDEIGLYLAPMESLVHKAGVILKLQPSFWGYIDEGDVCENDCGLDVPLTVYNREEVLRIFSSAHNALRKSGFANLHSFAVRGWLEAPFLIPLAEAFGYEVDASPIDPSLIARKLKEFPIAAWVTQRWGEWSQADPEATGRPRAGSSMRFLPQLGGILELNEQKEILARFDKLVKKRREHPKLEQVFTLGLSVETAFQVWPKLRMILQSIEERSKAQSFDLKYMTASATKNSRPTLAHVGIPSRLTAKAVNRK